MIIATTRSLPPSGKDALEFATKLLYASLIFDKTGIEVLILLDIRTPDESKCLTRQISR